MTIYELVLDRAEACDDIALEKAVSKSGAFIKEYCSLEQLPREIYPLWADIAVTFLQEDVGDVSDLTLNSVSIGDVSYAFNENGTAQRVATLMNSYKQRLNRFRRGLFR